MTKRDFLKAALVAVPSLMVSGTSKVRPEADPKTVTLPDPKAMTCVLTFNDGETKVTKIHWIDPTAPNGLNHHA
jgi:hypothetical protein